MKDESKKVYILLSKTKTVPSNLIKLMTREPYCHTSLALDISLDEMYVLQGKVYTIHLTVDLSVRT